VQSAFRQALVALACHTAAAGLLQQWLDSHGQLLLSCARCACGWQKSSLWQLLPAPVMAGGA